MRRFGRSSRGGRASCTAAATWRVVYGNVSALTGFADHRRCPGCRLARPLAHTAYTSTVTVWDVPNLSTTLWVNHQRIWQYAGGHNEAWSMAPKVGTSKRDVGDSVTLNIDCDVIDGIVASIPPPNLPFKRLSAAIFNGEATP